MRIMFFKDRERRAVDAWSLANVRLEQAGNTLNYQGGKIFLTMAGRVKPHGSLWKQELNASAGLGSRSPCCVLRRGILASIFNFCFKYISTLFSPTFLLSQIAFSWFAYLVMTNTGYSKGWWCFFVNINAALKSCKLAEVLSWIKQIVMLKVAHPCS